MSSVKRTNAAESHDVVADGVGVVDSVPVVNKAKKVEKRQASAEQGWGRVEGRVEGGSADDG